MRIFKPGRPKEINPFDKNERSKVPHSKVLYRFTKPRKSGNSSREILYIGYSNDGRRRLEEHLRSGKFTDSDIRFAFKSADGRASRRSLAEHEAKKIKQHSPKLNKRPGGAGRPFKRGKKA